MKRRMGKAVILVLLALALILPGARLASATHNARMPNLSPVRIVNDMSLNLAPSAGHYNVSPMRLTNDPAFSSVRVAARVVPYRYSPMRMVNDRFDADGQLVR